MDRLFSILERWGFVFAVLAGPLLHFAFEKSGYNSFVALIAPVNESVWEHFKLIYFPYISFFILELFILKKQYQCLLVGKTIGVILGIITTTILFYSYTGIIGKHYLWLDIVIFVVSVGVSCIFSYNYTIKNSLCSPNINIISLFILVSIMIMFFIFTFYPPKIPLFFDESNMIFGISYK